MYNQVEHLPEETAVDELADLHACKAEAFFVAQHEMDVVAFRGVRHLIAFKYGSPHGLFEQDVLARFGRSARDFTVGSGRRGNDDGIDIVAFEHLAVTGERLCSVAIAGFLSPVWIEIADGEEFSAWVFPDPGQMANPGCTSAADDSKANFGVRATRSLSGRH